MKYTSSNTTLLNIRHQLSLIKADGLLITDKINLLYLTGLELSAGQLLIHKYGAHLFVDPRYTEKCTKLSPFPVLPLNHPSFDSQLQGSEFSFIKTLGFESHHFSYADYQTLQKKLTDVTLIPVENMIENERMIKKETEIDLLFQAAWLGSRGYDYVCSLLKEGISENELSTELEIFWKREGGGGLAFDPIIAFGQNTSMPHYRPEQKKEQFRYLKIGDPILIDIGVKYHHYHSDMTRMAYFGTPHPELLKIHEIVAKAQLAALAICRPGTPIASIDSEARDYITRLGYGDKFTHNLGHGVGLDIHELPYLRSLEKDTLRQLQAGMVITIEPGIYLEGLGGVRIEDTIVITKDGYKNLTNRSTAPLVIKAVK